MNFISYFVSINAFTFFLCYLDKKKAIHHCYRIAESTLLLFSFFGGCFGMLLGMYLFHHKTRKLKFKLVPLSCVLWFLILYFYYI